MKTLLNWLPAVLAGAFLLGITGTAATIPRNAADEMKMMDKNNDGRLSALEHADGARSMFLIMDTDRDGRVSASEMGAATKPMKKDSLSPAEKIAAVDSDKDGLLSASEHASGAAALFTTMDADKDGFLTETELKAGRAARLKR